MECEHILYLEVRESCSLYIYIYIFRVGIFFGAQSYWIWIHFKQIYLTHRWDTNKYTSVGHLLGFGLLLMVVIDVDGRTSFHVIG